MPAESGQRSGAEFMMEIMQEMKRYAAFLRGVNISGKNRIRMPVLKAELEQAGFWDVVTVGSSGNIVFSSGLSDLFSLRQKIETLIREKFDLGIPVYVTEAQELCEVLAHAPGFWNSGDPAWYDNLIFILSDDSAQEIAALLGEPTAELEKTEIYGPAIFWTFDRKRYQKCAWWKKTADRGIGDKLTIRTANTMTKVCNICMHG